MRSRNRSRTRRREGAHELGDEVGVVGEVRREQLLFERDLGVREQHRELGRGQAEPGVVPVGELSRRSGAARRRGRGGRVDSSACMNRACTSSITGACARALSSARFWR